MKTSGIEDGSDLNNYSNFGTGIYVTFFPRNDVLRELRSLGSESGRRALSNKKRVNGLRSSDYCFNSTD